MRKKKKNKAKMSEIESTKYNKNKSQYILNYTKYQ